MTADTALPLDILSPAFVEDPVPMIDAMLEQAPVFFDPRLHAWMVGGYGDVKALEDETRLSSQREGYVAALLPPELRDDIKPLVEWYAGWMTMRDGAAHRRLRRLAAAAFQPRNIARLETRMVSFVDDVIDRALDKGEMEVMSELGYPLPRRVICDMVGIPASEMKQFTVWTEDLIALLAANLTTREAIAHACETRHQLRDYFAAKIAERRRAPVEDEVLSSLVQASNEDDSLSEEEIIDLVAFIMTGAYETTTQLIGNGLHLLLTHERERERVSADIQGKVPGLIEETLRVEPSITINTRMVTEAFDYKGARFEPGQMVYFMAIVANRDPAHFPDPHAFDIERENATDHISFGFGQHFCIGAPLARLEARVAFRRLLERAPKMRMAEQTIARVPNMVVRALQALHITL